MPRRRGLRPRLLAAVVRSNATLAFAAERQVVSQTGRMKLLHVVYEDGVIAIALVSSSDGPPLPSLALRWLKPSPYTRKDGQIVQVTNHMGGETDWFVVPSTLAAAIGRTLVEQKTAGLPGFQDDGFAALVRWLVENEELPDSMSY
jgi:hypothetical protein